IRSMTIGGSNYVIRGSNLNLTLFLGVGLLVTNATGTNMIESGFSRGAICSNLNPLATLIMSGPIDLAGKGLFFQGSGTFRVLSSITDPFTAAELACGGPGLVELLGTNAYIGATAVGGGTLLVNGIVQTNSDVKLFGGTLGGTGSGGSLVGT